MIGRPLNACVKCGYAVPQSAGFCPNCGTAVHDSAAFNITSDDAPETLLPRSVTGSTSAQPASTIGMASGISNAVTISPSGVVTALGNPTKKSGVRHAEGPFQPGQQINPRYTILKLLGTGGMGAVYQAFDIRL